MTCAKRFVYSGVENSVAFGIVIDRTQPNPDIPACSLTPISALVRTDAMARHVNLGEKRVALASSTSVSCGQT